MDYYQANIYNKRYSVFGKNCRWQVVQHHNRLSRDPNNNDVKKS